MTIYNRLWYVWLGRQGNSSEKLNGKALDILNYSTYVQAIRKTQHYERIN